MRVFSFAYSETMSGEQRLLSVPELSHHLAESYLTWCLYLQEMLQYKRQNHGKVQHICLVPRFPEFTEFCAVTQSAGVTVASTHFS